MNAYPVFVLVFLCATSSVQAQQSDSPDAELNRIYKRIEGRLMHSQGPKQELIKAQRAWIAFRDAECRFAASGVEGGSAYSDVYQSCQEDITKARIATFNEYLNCQEGDLGCPVPAN